MPLSRVLLLTLIFRARPPRVRDASNVVVGNPLSDKVTAAVNPAQPAPIMAIFGYFIS